MALVLSPEEAKLSAYTRCDIHRKSPDLLRCGALLSVQGQVIPYKHGLGSAALDEDGPSDLSSFR